MSDSIDALLEKQDAIDGLLGKLEAEPSAQTPAGAAAPMTPLERARAKNPSARELNVWTPTGVVTVDRDGNPVANKPDPFQGILQNPFTGRDVRKPDLESLQNLMAFASGGSLGLQMPLNAALSAAKGEGFGAGWNEARRATAEAKDKASFIYPLAGGLAAGGPGGAARALSARLALGAAQGAISGGLEAPPGDAASSAAMGAAFGAGATGLGEAGGAIATRLAKTFQNLPASLRNLAATQAIRALNPTKAQIRTLQGKTIQGQPGDIAVGEAMLKAGVIQPMETVEDLGARLAPEVKSRGEAIGNWLTEAQKIYGPDVPTVSVAAIARRIERDVVAPLMAEAAGPSQAAAAVAQREADLLREMVADGRLGRWVTLEDAERFIKRPHGAWAEKFAKVTGTPATDIVAKKGVYSAAQREIEERADALLARATSPGFNIPGATPAEMAAARAQAQRVAELGSFGAVKQAFAPIAEAAKIAEFNAPGLLTGRGVHPSDYGFGIAMGQAFNPADELRELLANQGAEEMQRFALGSLSALAHKLVRERGNTTLANLAWRAAPRSGLVGAPVGAALGLAGRTGRFVGQGAARNMSRADDNRDPELERAIDAFNAQ